MTSKKLLLLVISVFLMFPLYAQPGHGRTKITEEQIEAIEARRIAFLTEKMTLTPQEARLFWPVHNEYMSRIDDLNNEYRAFHATMPDAGKMTEEEASLFIEKELERMERAAALRREYQRKFLEILPAKKIAMLYEAERGFNRMLFRESQQRHQRDRR